MSRKLMLLAASVALFSGAVTFAQAADIMDPPVIDLPEPVMPVAHVAKGGWYIRGDIGYSHNQMSDVTYVTSGTGLGTNTLRGKLNGNYSVGAGVGYDTGDHLRVDLTADYFSKSNFRGSSSGNCPVGPTVTCVTTDSSSFTAISVMANAYIDLGKYSGFTPYVGAGIGGTHVNWGHLSNDYVTAGYSNYNEKHSGGSDIRFTYALMAGASYDVSDCVAVDAGYRFRKVAGGKMFNIGNGSAASVPSGTSYTGPGHDKGIISHDFRVGARYKFGGCGSAHVPDYQPDYQPVYK